MRTSGTSTGRGAATVVVLACLLAAGSAHYTVRPGDSLSAIAVRLGVAVQALVDANDIEDPDRIFAGQQLAVPGEGHRGGAPRRSTAAGPQGRAAVGELLEATARRYGWKPDIVKALAWQESGWNQAVVSSAGARGIMQVLPDTGRFVSRYLVGRPLDLADPDDNVTAGLAFLDHLYDLTDGDVRMTLAGYYQGLASVRRNGVYADTERYIDNVLALRARFR